MLSGFVGSFSLVGFLIGSNGCFLFGGIVSKRVFFFFLVLITARGKEKERDLLTRGWWYRVVKTDRDGNQQWRTAVVVHEDKKRERETSATFLFIDGDTCISSDFLTTDFYVLQNLYNYIIRFFVQYYGIL